MFCLGGFSLTFMILVIMACVNERLFTAKEKEAHMETDMPKTNEWTKTAIRALCSTTTTIAAGMWAGAALSG